VESRNLFCVVCFSCDHQMEEEEVVVVVVVVCE